MEQPKKIKELSQKEKLTSCFSDLKIKLHIDGDSLTIIAGDEKINGLPNYNTTFNFDKDGRFIDAVIKN